MKVDDLGVYPIKVDELGVPWGTPVLENLHMRLNVEIGDDGKNPWARNLYDASMTVWHMFPARSIWTCSFGWIVATPHLWEPQSQYCKCVFLHGSLLYSMYMQYKSRTCFLFVRLFVGEQRTLRGCWRSHGESQTKLCSHACLGSRLKKAIVAKHTRPANCNRGAQIHYSNTCSGW